jgi:hypothetical protein
MLGLRKQNLTLIGAMIVLALLLASVLWLRPASPPPVISLNLLGFSYTNGRSSQAWLAITNQSKSPITLDPQCQVEYGAGPITPPAHPTRVTAIEPNVFRVTRLRPNEGFVQDFFVFPGTRTNEWKFIYSASYRSRWLDARRSAENWYYKHILHSRWPPRSKTWTTFTSDWFPCPD